MVVFVVVASVKFSLVVVLKVFKRIMWSKQSNNNKQQQKPTTVE